MVINLTISEGIHLFIDIANNTEQSRIFHSGESKIEQPTKSAQPAEICHQDGFGPKS